ncbi:MAG: hypothetical protein K6T51_02480 [Rubrobacteraceae bacterium]|nr:hypothetical protein [Rubrobacteraceae bacterium]MCL6437450.1 hypothetical protein [Rubrobacteraceae bacterium]
MDNSVESVVDKLNAFCLSCYIKAERLRAGQIDTEDLEELEDLRRQLQQRYRSVEQALEKYTRR